MNVIRPFWLRAIMKISLVTLTSSENTTPVDICYFYLKWEMLTALGSPVVPDVYM